MLNEVPEHRDVTAKTLYLLDTVKEFLVMYMNY